MEKENKNPREKLELEACPSSRQNVVNHPTSSKGTDVHKRIEHQSQHLNTETSFTDNLMELYEGCRDEMYELKKKNRLQKEEISKLKIEASKWKTIAECYITSWDSVQPEFKSLRAQVDEAEERERELAELMELREKERENERRNMERRLEEREKEVCEQGRKMELMEKERREMEVKLNKLKNMKIELETHPKQDGRLVSATNGRSKTSEKTLPQCITEAQHLPTLCGSVASMAVASSRRKLRRARESQVMPDVVNFQQSTTINFLPSPPKTREQSINTPRRSVRQIVPLVSLPLI